MSQLYVDVCEVSSLQVRTASTCCSLIKEHPQSRGQPMPYDITAVPMPKGFNSHKCGLIK